LADRKHVDLPRFVLCAYFVAWPIAVRITDWLILRAGYKLQTVDPDKQ
jgi:hypothetical protein